MHDPSLAPSLSLSTQFLCTVTVTDTDQAMASSNSRSGGISELQSKKLWRERGEISPNRNVVWSEPQILKLKKVPILYYLSRNGHLEHPHFMEVPLSSPRGLFLKDVIGRLNVLRGKGMASMYSWSCKRSYRNGFVWHDLSEDDLIYPAHGHDYILKGSQLPENAFRDVASPPPAAARRRNQSCGSIDFDRDDVCPSGKSADVSTQTDDRRRHRRGEDSDCKELHRVEIEISTPPSDSSPETLGTLMKSDGQARQRHDNIRCRSSVLMQLISCGSLPFKDCGAGGGQRLIGGQHKTRGAPPPRGGGVKLEEKEYFSGSLVETKQREAPPVLKRSSSYSAERSLNLEVAEKEIEKHKAKCIPTKTKAHSSTRKEGHITHYWYN